MKRWQTLTYKMSAALGEKSYVLLHSGVEKRQQINAQELYPKPPQNNVIGKNALPKSKST